MKRGRGSRKGSAFERDICKRISLWWSKGKRDDIFWRTQGSGARATTRKRKGKSTQGQYGDVAATDHRAIPLIETAVIELKTGYGNASAADIIDKCGIHKPIYEKFFRQALSEMWAAKTWCWWVIARRHGRAPMLYMPISAWRQISRHGAAVKGNGYNPSLEFWYVDKQATPKNWPMYISAMPLDSFFEKISPKEIWQIHKHNNRPLDADEDDYSERTCFNYYD